MTYHTQSGTALAIAIFLALHAPPSAAATDVPAAPTHTFDQALASDYQALSSAESAQGDERDAATYAERAAAASAGQPTAPDEIILRQPFLKDRYVDELSTAHDRLLGALAKTARNDAPAAAARAQTSFDCWLEQASEDLQPEDIAACKQSFMTAMNTVERAMQPVAQAAPPEPPAPPPAPEAGTKITSLAGTNFDFDKATLRPEGADKLNQAVEVLREHTSVLVNVEGHTDNVGSDAYNQALSERRAQTVVNYLVGKGIDASRLRPTGYGESRPAESNDTGEGRAHNRRVDLVVAKAK